MNKIISTKQGFYTASITGLLVAATLASAADPAPVVNVGGTKISIYGIAQLDAAYEDSKSNNGNLANLVNKSDLQNEDDAGWYLTANHTRLGLNLDGPNDGTFVNVSGKVEFDFYGGGTEVNSLPRLRHGYGQVAFPSAGFTILGGQTWDVISPLNPPTANAGVLNNSGNLGARRPQLRLSEKVPVGEGSLEFAAAVVRTVGSTQPYVTNSASETGSDADIPTFQGRIGVSLPLWVEKQKLNLGVSGHWGKEEIDLDSAGKTKDLSTWSANVDLEIPVLSNLSLVGEGFLGQNLDAYAGNIGQGFTTATDRDDTKNVEGYGAWGALRFKPIPALALNAGAGIDKVKRSSITVGSKEQNISGFVNAFYNITPAFKVGVEYFRIQTDYLFAGGDVGEAKLNREQVVLSYSF